MMRYLSVCSGIEAASVAWHPLGWQPVAFSEIDPFASAVLASRFPGVPNLGNMENYREWNVPAFDVLVGGTPCQSFSVAGLRKGLDDPRGNLALVYLGLVDRFRPRWCVWENVPGVLSSSGGRDFGSFLGGLAQLGYGFAYRVLDAQYVRVESHPHAVPQRRRRVFVVGCAGGDWRSAAEVLLEPEGVRGDSAPRREARKGVAGGAADGARSDSLTNVIGFHHNAQACQLPTGARDTSISDSLTTSQNAAVALGFEPRYYARDNKTGGAPADTVALTASASKAGDSAPHVATISGFDVQNVALTGDVCGTLMGEAQKKAGQTGQAVAFSEVTQQVAAVHAATMAVRRLTPRECERLQGLPDDWTAITYRGKPAADGLRYKALGNSMAVNVMRFIGERIALKAAPPAPRWWWW